MGIAHSQDLSLLLSDKYLYLPTDGDDLDRVDRSGRNRQIYQANLAVLFHNWTTFWIYV